MVKQNKIQSIQEKIDNTEKELKILKEKLIEEQSKDDWLEIPNKGIKINTKLQFKGKTYSDILKQVDESEVANYQLLQELRNEGFKSNWTKYAFLKDFYAFVPQTDEVAKSNGYVARFYSYSSCTGLRTYYFSYDSVSSLGVFVIKKLKKDK